MSDLPRTLLTGATGFIGQRTAAQLLRAGCRVTALVRRPDSQAALRLQAQGVRLVVGDVTDRESLRDPLQHADLVLHAAGLYELGVDSAERARMSTVNVTGTDNVMSLAHELRCPRVLHVSSATVYGNTGTQTCDERHQRRGPAASHYDATMLQAHRVALRWARRGLPVVLACPNAVVGPNDHSVLGHFLRLHVNHLMPPVAACPDAVLRPVHVDDVARGLVAVALRGRVGQVYNLGGERCTLKEIFTLWHEEVPGGAAVRWWLPAWSTGLLYSPLGPLLRAAGSSAFVSAETARQAACSLDCSSAKAQRELGWRPLAARAMWRDIGAQEVALLARRHGQDLVRRLAPLNSQRRGAGS